VRVQLDVAETFKPYRKQAEWLCAPNLFRLFLGGVGSGKTWCLTLWTILQMMANNEVSGALLGRTYRDLQTVLLPQFFGHLDELQKATGVNWIKKYSASEASLQLITGKGSEGSKIWFRPYNRIDKLRGLEFGWAAADEVEFAEASPDAVWQVLTGRMRAPCPRPGLAFATSPNGLRGMTKQFHEAQLRKDGRYYVATATSLDNPFLPDHYFDALSSMSRRRYEQEVLGRVLRPLSSVFTLDDRHMVDWDWRQHPDLATVIGVDWGGENHHVAAMAQVLEDGSWIWSDELVCDEMSRGQFRQVLRSKIDEQWNRSGTLRFVGADRAAPMENQWLRSVYGARGVRVRWADKSHVQYVVNGIEMMRDALEPAAGPPIMMFAKSLPELHEGTAGILTAMANYRYKTDREGNPTTIPFKDNVNDHMADAMRYAWICSGRLPELHGGSMLSAVGLGPVGDHAHGRSNPHNPHW